MGGPEAALLLVLVVHVIGSLVLIWALFAGQEPRPDWRAWWRGEGPDDPPSPAPEPRGPTGDGLPLPGAERSGVRLREPGRIAERYTRPARRPAREPEHQPAREPVPPA